MAFQNRDTDEPFGQSDVEQLANALQNNVVSGGDVTWHALDLSLDLTAATVLIAGTLYTIGGATIGPLAPDGTNPLWAYVVADKTAPSFEIVAGDAAADPLKPAIDFSARTILYAVRLNPGDAHAADIAAANRTYDKRVPPVLGAGGAFTAQDPLTVRHDGDTGTNALVDLQSKNAAGAYVSYGQLLVGIENNTAGSEAGDLVVKAALGGALTSALTISSAGGVLAVQHPDGTATLPGISFLSDTDTGFYRSGSGEVSAASNGSQSFKVGLGYAACYGASASSCSLYLDGVAVGVIPRVVFEEAGSAKYVLYYDAPNNDFALQTTDSDGIGTTADVFRVPDGSVTMQGNGTFNDNAFDYVCSSCGRHEAEEFTCCGPVTWHDDVALMHSITRKGWMQSAALDRMQALGLMQRHEDGWIGVNLNVMPFFLMSGMAQMWDRLNAIEERVA